MVTEHSNETILFSLFDDLYTSLDNNKPQHLILLDVSSAFDTFDVNTYYNKHTHTYIYNITYIIIQVITALYKLFSISIYVYFIIIIKFNINVTGFRKRLEESSRQSIQSKCN